MSVVKLTAESFEEEVLKEKKPVLIDFWAAWCGPCKMLSPVVDALAKERDDIKVCKVNVDEQSEIAEKFNIMTIPTLMVFKDGVMVHTSVGVKTKAEILAFIGV